MFPLDRTSGLEPVLAGVARATDAKALKQTILRARDHLLVEHLFHHWVNRPGGQDGVGTYPADWKARYIASGYVRMDPVVQACWSGFDPVDWKSLDWSHRMLRDFLEESARHGLGHQGWSIPVHGPRGEFAIFTVNHSCSDTAWADFVRRNGSALQVLARAVHARARALHLQAAAQADTAPPLTPREADVIALIAAGHSRARAARLLEISEHTLRDHLESARAKLEAQNTTHAVAVALSRGLVPA